MLPDLPEVQLRNTRLHFLDARIDPSTGTPLLVLVGDDNEDMTRETPRNTESKLVVTGRFSISSARESETMAVADYALREGEPLGLLLQHFDISGAEHDQLKRAYYEVKFDNSGNVEYAFKMWAWIPPDSFGGAASGGDLAPFTCHFDGVKVPQTFTEVSKGNWTFADI
jgi:hypothetical protein